MFYQFMSASIDFFFRGNYFFSVFSGFWILMRLFLNKKNGKKSHNILSISIEKNHLFLLFNICSLKECLKLCFFLLKTFVWGFYSFRHFLDRYSKWNIINHSHLRLLHSVSIPRNVSVFVSAPSYMCGSDCFDILSNFGRLFNVETFFFNS